MCVCVCVCVCVRARAHEWKGVCVHVPTGYTPYAHSSDIHSSSCPHLAQSLVRGARNALATSVSSSLLPILDQLEDEVERTCLRASAGEELPPGTSWSRGAKSLLLNLRVSSGEER